MSDTEQDKTEEATPFKLKKAREKGQVARGTDLGFFATMSALALYTFLAGPEIGARLAEMMRRVFLTGMEEVTLSRSPLQTIADAYAPIFQMLALLGGTVVLTIITLEILQLRGLMFSAHPLKPDFNRINPAQGLKRFFSMRMLKDALKNIFKMAVYCTAAVTVAWYCIQFYDRSLVDADHVTAAMFSSAQRLILAFTILAIIFAAIDQIIVRQDFKKQMRMSRSELKRENKDREGEPRQKRKRKELHAEFVKQTGDLGDLPGSDILLINPQHFAVALSYAPGEMTAPKVSAKGRNRFALHLRREARRHGIAVFRYPSLARVIYKHHEVGQEIRSKHYYDIAQIYLKLRREAVGDRPSEGSTNV
ncbi:MAG: EscU/YscU/HrcU family type III secretion system export apparatus switch protein [Pseudomonadota bacterium]